MEKAPLLFEQTEIRGREVDELVASLYYFRSALAGVPENDLLIFLIEMAIVEVSSCSRAALSR